MNNCPGCNRCECCGKWMHEIDAYWFKYADKLPQLDQFRCDYKVELVQLKI